MRDLRGFNQEEAVASVFKKDISKRVLITFLSYQCTKVAEKL
jgi:hypothetical protein